jgi:hypothetical protein
VLGADQEVMFSNEGESWQLQRKKASPFFSPSILRGQFDSGTVI